MRTAQPALQQQKHRPAYASRVFRRGAAGRDAGGSLARRLFGGAGGTPPACAIHEQEASIKATSARTAGQPCDALATQMRWSRKQSSTDNPIDRSAALGGSCRRILTLRATRSSDPSSPSAASSPSLYRTSSGPIAP